jgi:BirA family biotin operon repressor/biotin-[acetyl-CoA-carboxylase] ligase
VVDYSYLSEELSVDTECFILDTIPSTNDFLAALPFSDKIQVCVAREQTSGKGQYQRKWASKRDSSVLVSVRRNFKNATSLNGLSLVIGMALIDVLERDYEIKKLKLKWPNDLYFKNMKIAGILIENTVQNKSQTVVIGIGVNNNLNGELECETPWTDLTQILTIPPKIETLTAKIINKVIKYCDQFEQRGLNSFQSRWLELDYLINKKLKVSHDDKEVIGVADGINEQGALLVQRNGKAFEVFSSEQIKLI